MKIKLNPKINNNEQVKQKQSYNKNKQQKTQNPKDKDLKDSKQESIKTVDQPKE